MILPMVKYISDRIGVMHNGRLWKWELVMKSITMAYPYTESLISAIPLPDPDHERQRKRIKYQPEPDDGQLRALRDCS